MKIKHVLLKTTFVVSKDKLNLETWISDVLLKGMEKPDKLKIVFNKKYQTVNELHGKTVSEDFVKWKH